VQIEPGIFEITLHSHRSYSIYLNRLVPTDRDFFRRQLLNLIAELSLFDIHVIVQHPFWSSLIEQLPYDVWYDCLDDHTGFSVKHKNVEQQEKKLVSEVDGIFVSSRTLQEKWQSAPKPVVLVPNAADVMHFNIRNFSETPEVLKKICDPIIGYFGALDHWLNVELITKIAQNHPEWSFVFIGDITHKSVLALSKLSNVLFLGEIPYSELPPYVHRFTVGWIPFRLIPLIKATSPVKFYEMAAANLPIVATHIPELEPYQNQNFLWLADTPNEMEQVLLKAIESTKAERRLATQTLLKKNDWRSRASDMQAAFQNFQPSISIVIVSYQNVHLTLQCLQSVVQHVLPKTEIIIVDNNSDPDCQQQLHEWCSHHPGITFIQNSENLGFARANNQGLAVARGDILILLNNDTVITSDWLDRIIHHLQNPQIGLLGPVTNMIGNEARIIFNESISISTALKQGKIYADRHIGVTSSIPMLAGFCWAIRRDVLEKVGNLDEDFGIGMFEDDDFCRRIKKVGYKLALAHDIFIYHVGRAAFKQLSPTTYQELFARNKKIFEKKWNLTWQPHRYSPIKK
jgi:GT2 family glycosyltransferase/glycosyltransferase involved in cell wall biosynthesis